RRAESRPRLLDEDGAFVHRHAALERERAPLRRGDLDRDGRVQRQRFLQLELGKHDLFGASLVARANEDELGRLALLELDLTRRKALLVDLDLRLLDAGGSG